MASKLPLSGLDPIIQPGQQLVLSDPFAAQTRDDFSNGEFGNSFLLGALKYPALTRDLKQFRNVGACFRLKAEE
jgi:hypothetical protein